MLFQLLPALEADSSRRRCEPLAQAEAVLCDMDGTLVDSTAVVEAMWELFAHQYGLGDRFDEIMEYSPGRTSMDTISHFLPHLPEEQRAAISRRFVREETTRTEGITEVPGAAALVAGLLEAGVPTALVTSASEGLMRARMGAAGVPVPPVTVCAGDVARGKPAPDAYLRAAELVGVPIGSCLVLEDAPSGYIAARAAGAAVLLVGSQPGSAENTPWVPDLRGLRVARV